jgi:hypothetical protein
VAAAELVVDDAWALYRRDSLRLWWITGVPVEPAFERFLQTWQQEIESRDMSAPIAVLFEMVEILLTPSQRARLVQVQAEREDKIRRTTRAFAMASPSRLTRGMLTAIYWLWPPPYPYRVTADTRAGFDFLSQHVSFDAAAVDAEWTAAKQRMAAQRRRR